MDALSRTSDFKETRNNLVRKTHDETVSRKGLNSLLGSRQGSRQSGRAGTPLTKALEHHRERFAPFKVSHKDEHGNVVRFADPKTRGRSFDINNIEMPYNPNRFNHVNVRDALVDPNTTIKPERTPPKKDLGYQELNKRNTFANDKHFKELKDYTGKTIIKLDGNDCDVKLEPKHWMQYSLHTSNYATPQKSLNRKWD